MRRKLHRPEWLKRSFWVHIVVKHHDNGQQGRARLQLNLDSDEARVSADLQDAFGDPRNVQDDNKSFQGSGDANKSSGPRDMGLANSTTGQFSRDDLSEIQHRVGVKRMSSPMSTSPEVFGGSSLHPPSYDGSAVGAINSRRTGQSSTFHQPSLHPGTTEVSAVSEFTGNAYTIVEDGGQDLQSKQIDLKREPPASEEKPQSGSVPSDENAGDEKAHLMIQLTKSRLHKERIASARDISKWFIPKSGLAKIITLEMVSVALRSYAHRPLNEQQRLDMAKQICGTPKKTTPSNETYQAIFALLIKLRKHDQITVFVDHMISDSRLPLVKNDWKEFSHSIPMPPWDDEDQDEFLRLQWEFIPAFIAKKGKKIPHYELHPSHVLPYVHVDKAVKEKLDKDKNHDMEGSFGKVSIYNLHQGQQDLDRYTVDGLNGLVAVKKLTSDDREAFLQECKVLMRLTPQPTPHLAKLLATYEQPAGRDQHTPEFFLMFECAESNLERFWTTFSPERLMKEHGLSLVQLSRWMAKQCTGLAQGLKTLHSHTTDKSASPPNANPKSDQPSHGLHGDIKPANVLRYTNWKDPARPDKPLDAPLGVLQITDFGLSSYHHTITAQDIKLKIGASAYKPPEAHLIYPVSQSVDIWTMGCLFLDFITWLVLGDDGRQTFCKRREKSGKDLISESQPCFFDVREKKGTTKVSKSRAVMSWAKELCRTAKSDFIHDFVELVLARMLVIEDKAHLDTEAERSQTCNRISASDLAHELDRLVTGDDNYYKPRDKPKAPSLEKYNQSGYIIEINQTVAKVRSDVLARHRSNKDDIPRRNT